MSPLSGCARQGWLAVRPSTFQSHQTLRQQVREEAGELCQTLEQDEGQERTASEMADLLYHAMVLLNSQVCRCHVRRLSQCARWWHDS